MPKYHLPHPVNHFIHVRVKDLERIGCLVTRSADRTEARLASLEQEVLDFIGMFRKPQVHFEWAIGLVETKQAPKGNMLQIKITNEQQVTVTLNPKTQRGKSVSLDGAPIWEIVSGESVAVKPSEDGLSALLVSSDTPGTTQVLVKADADLGEGYVEVSEIIEVTVSGALAANLGLVVGEPELKPTE